MLLCRNNFKKLLRRLWAVYIRVLGTERLHFLLLHYRDIRKVFPIQTLYRGINHT